MKCIVLAAGKDKNSIEKTPKCMLELYNKPLIKYQLDLFEKFNTKDINVIAGYLEEKIDFDGVRKFYNSKFDSTNMVSILFCASELFDGEDYDNMYMTSFLQMIADNIIPLTPVYIKGGWIEIDEPSDLNFGDFLRR
jgi:NDP-sugar pyrophosphorylase family protein